MSELISLVARGGGRWTDGCRRLVREYRLYCPSKISSCGNAGETWSKLSCPVSVATRTISRQLTSCSSLKGLPLGSRQHFCVSFRLSADIRGPWRAASTVPEQDIPALPEDECEVLSCSHDLKTDCLAEASRSLQRLLGIDAADADLHIKKHRHFADLNPEGILQNYKACRDAGLSQATIRQNVEILSSPFKILRVKIESIADMNIVSMDDAVPFFKLGIDMLRIFASKIKHETIANKGTNRIIYLTEQLQCPMLTVCELVAKHYFLRSASFSKLRQVLDIMLDFHVTRDDILNDVWAFRYNPEMITKRFKTVTDAGVYPVKPWMIRCSEQALARRIGKAWHQRSVLGDSGTIIEYLSQRFECDKDRIIVLIEKDPRIAQVSGPKMKKTVDFLLENGYTVEHVIRAPLVFFRRLETMQECLAALQKYRHKPKSLVVFCKSKQQFHSYLETIKLRSLLTAGE